MAEITLDEICYFCHTEITPRQERGGLKMTSMLGHIAHRDCMEYTLAKFPNVAISELEGKLNRTRIDLTNLKDRILHENFAGRQVDFPKYDRQNQSLPAKHKTQNSRWSN